MESYFHREPHFLEECCLCRRSLAFNSDIFMYRGDKPFCSEECREEQIEMDEAHERKTSSSSSASFHRKDSLQPDHTLVHVSS